MHIMYTYQIITFFQKKWLYYNNYTHVRGIFLCGTNIWCLYNTTKIPIIFICMKIFQHFCDVFVPYYKIVILNFYYHTSNKLPNMVFYSKNSLWDGIFSPLKQTTTHQSA
jgi:hypothetical protein